MSDREQFRLDARVWTIAVIGMVIGGVVGLLIWGPLQMIPFAMIGFALGLAIAWMRPARPGQVAGTRGRMAGRTAGRRSPATAQADHPS